MTIKQIREKHQARPFQPFDIIVADGHIVPVKHPEVLAILPPGRTIVVGTGEDGRETIDLFLVTTLRNRNGKSETERRRK